MWAGAICSGPILLVVNPEPMRVNVAELLKFMNSGDPEANKHHTAITGLMGEPLAVALIEHYLRSVGKAPRLLDWKVTQGTKSGPRLDAWIHDGQDTLYQTEIKMWAVNAIGGLRLTQHADEVARLTGGNRQWARLWNATEGCFQAENVNKVLQPMNRPRGHEQAQVEALACFWWMVQPPGGSAPWFTVKTSSPHFSQVNVFSLTAYLMTLQDEELHLNLDLIPQRLRWLKRLFPG